MTTIDIFLPLLVTLLTVGIVTATIVHSALLSQHNTSATKDNSTDDRTYDILNRMAEYEDMSEEELAVIDVPNLAEDNERQA